MSRRYLRGFAAAPTPKAAAAFYRHPAWRWLALAGAIACSLVPTPTDRQVINRLFAELRARFTWRAESGDTWGNAVVRVARLVAGKWIRYWFGDCDDFAVMLLAALVRAGVPRGACRLAVCQVRVEGRGDLVWHLVLVIDTEAGSLVCDQRLPRPVWGDDPALRGVRWHSIEAPPARAGAVARWLSLQTLEEILARQAAAD